MKLVIVESPTKTKTISKYLGKEYTVKASVGHIRDLPKSNKDAINIDAGFVPNYVVSTGKEKVLNELKSLSKKASEIILATDPDREGEAIAWHIAEALELNKHAGKVKRIAFNEITKTAVQEALKHPRNIDQNLRSAQEARRVLDRLVGYDLSGLIWKKVRYGLSAGRVQSPALRILVEREREIQKFIPVTFWVITAQLQSGLQDKNKIQFSAVCTEEPKEKKETDRILSVGRAGTWKVKAVTETSAKRKPHAPFTTSTLQQTASSRLGYSPSNTMRIAQKLYEAGLITYMRTDSTTISALAQKSIQAIIKKQFGDKHIEVRIFKTKSKNAQEAHEAIRPSDPLTVRGGASPDQQKLYDLIWRRTIASQMKDAQILRTKVAISVNDGEVPDFAVSGAQTKYDGWLMADPKAKQDDVELPALKADEILKLLELTDEEKQTQPPSRYSEAGLVRELEKRGIGRPSTYASIIKTINDRGYVDKVQKALVPTEMGMLVSTFLEDNFAQYISDTFTADMENKLDEIADGDREYVKTLKDFYDPFKTEIKSKEKIEKITNLGPVDDKFKCPTCGKAMIFKLGKAGKFMSCNTFPDCSGMRTADGEELQGEVETGEDCPKCKDGKLIERDGRYGRFIACKNYPKCKFIKSNEEEEAKRKTGVICTECKTGEMTEKKGRFGLFFACSNYPDCKHTIKTKPTGNKCDYKKEDGSVCNKLMMEGTKTIPDRCSDKQCPNHHPHKLNKE